MYFTEQVLADIYTLEGLNSRFRIIIYNYIFKINYKNYLKAVNYLDFYRK